MRLRRTCAQIWLVLLLGGVGGASLIPPGYMPGLNATGDLALVLCSGEVISTSDRADDAFERICWFSAIQTSALQHLPVLSSVAPKTPQNAMRSKVAPRARVTSTPLPRGPPQFS